MRYIGNGMKNLLGRCPGEKYEQHGSSRREDVEEKTQEAL